MASDQDSQVRTCPVEVAKCDESKSEDPHTRKLTAGYPKMMGLGKCMSFLI